MNWPHFDPPLSERFAWLEKTIILRPAADGYPVRLHNGKWVAHPMDARYFLDDYLDCYLGKPSSKLREAIGRMTDAAVNRMEPFGEGLVFWYGDELQVLRANGRRTYSGLTQAYYARAFARAAIELDRADLASMADRCYASIEIPYEEGGVLYRREGEVAIAQVPSDPRDLVLNGWLSSLVAIDDYATLRGRRDARDLVLLSAEFLATLLPLYDVPRLRNSRYALTGWLDVELRFSEPRSIRIEAVELLIPGERRYRTPVGEHGHWETHLLRPHVLGPSYPVRPKRNAVRARLVLSLVGAPDPSVLVTHVRSDHSTRVSLYARLGQYDPAHAVPKDPEWTLLESRDVGVGRHVVTFPLPWELLDRVVPATNFAKVVDGRSVNSYHPTHVRRLRQLGKRTGIAAFDLWADRWNGYMRDWAAMPEYRGRSVLIDGTVTKVGAPGLGVSG